MNLTSSHLLKNNRYLLPKAEAKTRIACLRFCLRLECGGGERDRTDDPLLAKQVLSQLSYTPGFPCCGPRTACVVGLDGLEPSTPALSRRCSNQLSYRPSPRDPTSHNR